MTAKHVVRVPRVQDPTGRLDSRPLLESYGFTVVPAADGTYEVTLPIPLISWEANGKTFIGNGNAAWLDVYSTHVCQHH